MPSRRAAASMASCLRVNEKSASVMVSVKCLAILYLPTTAPALSAILAVPRSGFLGAANPVLDFDKVTPGCGEQILALASARDGELGVSADDQALAGIVIGSDAGEITLIEQRELEDPRIDQGTDLRGAQRGDPVEPGWLDILLEASLDDHAAVADEHHVAELEPLLELA